MVLTRLSSARPVHSTPDSHDSTSLAALPAAPAPALPGGKDSLRAHMVSSVNGETTAQHQRAQSPLFAVEPLPSTAPSHTHEPMATKPVDYGKLVWPALLTLLDSYARHQGAAREAAGWTAPVVPTPPGADSAWPDDRTDDSDRYLSLYDAHVEAFPLEEKAHTAPGAPDLEVGDIPVDDQPPAARALAFDQSLASPLFETEDYLSPYLDAMPSSAVPFGSASAPADAWAPADWSPVLSDVSPALTVSNDFNFDGLSGSPSPHSPVYTSLFGDATFTPAHEAPSVYSPDAAAAAPVFSPVIGPTEMPELEMSPSAMLPPPLPPLPPLSEVRNTSETRASSVASSVASEDGADKAIVTPATPPAEVDDLATDPDFDPASRRRSRRAASQRPVTRTSTARRVSASPSSSSPSLTGAGQLRVTDLDAPVQDRKYLIESRTSAKAIPKNLALRRAKKVARGESVSSEREAVDEAAKRRQANTLAARESRKRKAEYLSGLEEQVSLQAEEIELLKAENEGLRRENARLAVAERGAGGVGGQVAVVKMEDEQVEDGLALAGGVSKKRRRV